MIFFAGCVHFYKLIVNFIVTRREKMQQRFCGVCGFPIWVQYRISQTSSKTVFWTRQDAMAENIKKCPCCWKQFDIDTLA
jgi:hypothetical protein